MKKERIVLKMWVEELLIVAQCFWFIVLTTECEDLNILMAIKVPTIIFMYLNHILLARYTDFYKKGF